MVSTAAIGFVDGAYGEYRKGLFGDQEAFIRVKDLDRDTSNQPDTLDVEVDSIVQSLLDKPELALHMAKTNLRGYARLRSLGDASEADGDLFKLAQGSADFRQRFGMTPGSDSDDENEQ